MSKKRVSQSEESFTASSLLTEQRRPVAVRTPERSLRERCFFGSKWVSTSNKEKEKCKILDLQEPFISLSGYRDESGNQRRAKKKAYLGFTFIMGSIYGAFLQCRVKTALSEWQLQVFNNVNKMEGSGSL